MSRKEVRDGSQTHQVLLSHWTVTECYSCFANLLHPTVVFSTLHHIFPGTLHDFSAASLHDVSSCEGAQSFIDSHADGTTQICYKPLITARWKFKVRNSIVSKAQFAGFKQSKVHIVGFAQCQVLLKCSIRRFLY